MGSYKNRNITAEDNIFAFGAKYQIDHYARKYFEFTSRRNLIYYLQGEVMRWNADSASCAIDCNQRPKAAFPDL